MHVLEGKKVGRKGTVHVAESFGELGSAPASNSRGEEAYHEQLMRALAA
jgi:hypothetical protein